ncbi:restriction endonuclease subunit S [Maridesulfovibrio sp.]|uniref:restriction endonuclease subunit S n=1 Tax=Maridesulfovibrio sp. TaxID=2795000 RepID=UPI0029CA0006|nr:restriction endonuclease subunit S [Maridesulfovibrio sp.]
MSWDMVSLGEIAPSKAANKQCNSNGSVWMLNLDQVESGSGLIISKKYVSSSDVGSSTICFDDRHVLYSKLRPNLNKVVVPDQCGIATSELIPMCPDHTRLDRQYLAHFLRSPEFVWWAVNRVSGAKMPRVVMKCFWEKEIPLPPLNEQKRIAAILDKADVIRRKRQQAIEKADEFLRSVFLDMFGDPVLNPKGWEVCQLEEHIDFLTSGSRGWAKYYSNAGEKFIRIQNVKNGLLNFDDIQHVNAPDTKEAIRTKVEADDLLISITADLGRTAVVDDASASDGAYINQHLALVRLKSDVNPDFLSAFIESAGGKTQFKRMNQNGVKAGLNFAAIKSFNFYSPPIDLQNKYSKIKKHVHSVYSAKLNKSQRKAEEQFSSLQQKAFKGEL